MSVKQGLILFFVLISLILLVAVIAGGKLLPANQSALLVHSPTPTPVNLEESLEVVRGTAVVARAGEKINLSHGNNTLLKDSDQITTGGESIAVINYRQGSVVRLDSGSSVVFREKTPTAGSLIQKAGNIFVRFAKILGLRETFTLETPTTIATVRGTSFASFIKSALETKIVVTRESVEVALLDESTGQIKENTRQTIAENKQAVVAREIVVGDISLEPDESKWMAFNQQADALGNDPNALFELAELFLLPSPSPTATPAPTPSPVPIKPPPITIDRLPSEGYSRSQVVTNAGVFTLSCMGANKNSTRVITDSGNDSNCKDNCTVLPLHEYASRNGGFAAVNGMYFCPADYDWCAGKVNSFDTLFFNSRSKNYINSDNNVYSVIPFLAIEANGNPVFKRHSYEWGRDTGIQAGTAGNPLMIAGGSNVLSSYTLDTKMQTVKASRAAFAQEGDTVYLCVVAAATVPDATKVYEKLGADNAINFDSGGSTAFWVNGSYIYGPGRNIPTAIIFARK